METVLLLYLTDYYYFLLPIHSALTHSVGRQSPSIPLHAYLQYTSPGERLIFQQPGECAALCCCFVHEQFICYF